MVSYAASTTCAVIAAPRSRPLRPGISSGSPARTTHGATTAPAHCARSSTTTASSGSTARRTVSSSSPSPSATVSSGPSPAGDPASRSTSVRISAALDEELSSFGLKGYVQERTDVLRQPFNWKLVVDGFLETYHIRFLHRNTIGPYINSNFAMFDPFGVHGRMIGLRTSFTKAVVEAPPHERDFLPHIAIIYLIFPNTVLVWQSDHFEVWSVFPDPEAPSGMVARASLLAPRRATSDEETRHWDKNWKILMKTVLEEDFVIAKTMQNGFQSGVRSHAVFGRQEATLQHYHQMLEREMAAGPASPVVAPRRVGVPA